jgi:hypothetical protein
MVGAKSDSIFIFHFTDIKPAQINFSYPVHITKIKIKFESESAPAPGTTNMSDSDNNIYTCEECGDECDYDEGDICGDCKHCSSCGCDCEEETPKDQTVS